jgi:uncharacterized repeat protein (TIGR03803 family)
VGTVLFGGAKSRGTLYSVGMDGSSFRVLHDFGGTGDGNYAYAAPILVGSVLYGTTRSGGANPGGDESPSLGAGVLYWLFGDFRGTPRPIHGGPTIG